MLTPSGYGAISSFTPAKLYRTGAERDSRIHTAAGSQAHESYDSVTLSAPSQGNRFLSMVSRLSQEVRTANTTGDIAKLRQEVAAGEYTPDPAAIAARILYLGEGS